MSLRPSEAQQAELCAYSVALRIKNTPTTSPKANFGRAFAASIADDFDELKIALSHLSMDEVEDVRDLVDIYREEMPVPATAKHEWTFALKADGRLCDWEDPERVTRGAIDHWWEEDNGEAFVVRDDKTGDRPVTHPAENLQLAPYVVAVSQLMRYGAKAIGEVANPKLGKLYRYEYQPGEVERLWQRFLKAEAKTRATPVLAEPGGHCSECYQRDQCDVRMLPAIREGAMQALEPFIIGGPLLTPETAAIGLRTIQAMQTAVDRADEALRSWVLENGPIVDGTKEWCPGESQGRESADLKLLKADGLTKYIKRGKPYLTFRWRNR